MNELALFAGAGGGILGSHLLGWRTVCAVEIEPYPSSVLVQRQNDGIFQPFPIWSDVSTFDGRPWRGIVDVVSGGFPCQDISVAGKGAGIGGARSSLWSEMFRIICEVRPQFAFMENSPRLTRLGLERVLADLASIGYDATWDVFSASDLGANHERKRIWILAQDAHTTSERRVGTTNAIKGKAPQKVEIWSESSFSALLAFGKSRYPVISEDERMGDGMASGMEQLKAIGNGQVPVVEATAFGILHERLMI